MADPTGNEPASPVVKTTESVERVTAKYRGLTKREEIAKTALAANRIAMGPDFTATDVAAAAVADADALLAELAKDGAQ
jgi:hypothetical protein